MGLKCILCDKRKPKRYCPAKRTYICPVCCGEKRGIEISCPLDCPFFVEGQKYQQEKLTRQRVKKEGFEPYIKRAELYSKNPELFARIELAMVNLFRAEGGLTNRDVAEALELVIKTLETEKKGIIYEYRSDNRMVNELVRQILSILREYKDSPELKRVRITVDYAKDVVEEFLKEVKFFIEVDPNPQSYLVHVARYHPEKIEALKDQEPLIVLT